MLEYLTGLYVQFSEATKNNPVLAGVVSLWGLGVATYLLRSIPTKLWRLVSQQCSTGLTLNSAGLWENRMVFIDFMAWYGASRWAKFSRRLSVEARRLPRSLSGDAAETVVGPGYGWHFFFMDGWLYWFEKEMMDSTGSDLVKERINLYCLGRNRARLDRIIERFSPPPPADDDLSVYVWDGEERYWDRVATMRKRPLASVAMPPAVAKPLLAALGEFNAQREWYIAAGLPHKMTVVLHGPPGCGKTSMVKALASHHNASIYTLNLNAVSDQTFQRALSRLPQGAFLLIEDFDSAAITKTRGTQKAKEDRSEAEDMAAAISSLTLSGLLNALDGVVPLDNLVIFMTTNHIESIDPAILRKGRTDLVVEVGPLSDAEIHGYVRHVFGRDIERRFDPITGADLQALLLEHKTDFAGFADALVSARGANAAILSFPAQASP